MCAIIITTSRSVRQQWGDCETVAEKVAKCRLEWLGHLARMPDEQTPPRSACSAGCLNLTHGGGPHKRWRDVIRMDLKEIKIPDDVCYEEATSRVGWRATYKQARADTTCGEQHHEQAVHQVQCPECQHTFRRESDMKRHLTISTPQHERSTKYCLQC